MEHIAYTKTCGVPILLRIPSIYCVRARFESSFGLFKLVERIKICGMVCRRSLVSRNSHLQLRLLDLPGRDLTRLHKDRVSFLGTL